MSTGLLLLALWACETPQTPVDDACPYSCVELLPRYEATLALCGLAAADYPLDCDRANAERLSCQVGCLEAADCAVFAMDDLYLEPEWDTYGSCSATCPSAVW